MTGRLDGQTVRRVATGPGTVEPSSRPTPSWCLIIDRDGRSGAENMAVDLALLRAAQAGEVFLRFYRWSPPCLSLGRNEPALSRYDRHLIETLGLDVVRRPTGGRAVWHNAEVTYAVAAPAGTFGALPQTYREVHRLIARALRHMGVLADLAPRPPGGHVRPGAGACFASPAGGEVVVNGRKLVGSAQVREGEAFLQHGSILLDDGQDIVSRVTRGAHLPPLATSLSASLGRPAGFDEVVGTIIREARSSWTGGWTDRRYAPPTDLVAKFGDAAWTWRR